MTHAEILSEVLAIAKAKQACASEYGRAEKSKDMAELAAVLGDNFRWCCTNKLLTADTITRWGLREHGIRCNEDVTAGHCLVSGSATVRASGSATVDASDTATVRAYDRAAVRAYGSATVRASGSATVEAYGSATVEASGSATVRAYDRAAVRAYGSATVRASGIATVEASGSATVEASDMATVRAYDTATVRAYDIAAVEAYDTAYVHSPLTPIQCNLYDRAVLRHVNKITAANGETITF